MVFVCNHEGCGRVSKFEYCRLHRPRCPYVKQSGVRCNAPTSKYEYCHAHSPQQIEATRVRGLVRAGKPIRPRVVPLHAQTVI